MVASQTLSHSGRWVYLNWPSWIAKASTGDEMHTEMCSPSRSTPLLTYLKINLEITAQSRWHKDFVTPSRIKHRGTQALSKWCWELEMHIMSHVYRFSTEYLVFTLELIQAHKTSDLSTQQMYLSNSTLKGDSLTMRIHPQPGDWCR